MEQQREFTDALEFPLTPETAGDYTGETGKEQYVLELEVEGRVVAIKVASFAPLVNLPQKGPQLSRSAAQFRMHSEIGGGLLERSLKTKFAPGGEYRDPAG